ncbi:L,D-transpeptidase [Acidisphaera sp. L21]|uniref:L,D-transpeptidase n=1 Tax=Acidisphaera sp. L21 TaxID=1641851 RepID=UPI00131D9D03|nr:L,D-transpeptidase [Acidisphaera sp. L21]
MVQTKPATRADVDALLADMHASLAGTLLPDAPLLTRAALGAAQGMLQKANITHDRLQTILVVDRSPKVQRLWVTVASSSSPYLEVLGSVHVSTGKPGRKEHFRTPVGVFVDNAGILGYRAQGTYNEFHIRGIGVKGMRVWDFGWQTTDDWRTPNAIMAVRMEMHATDPAVLEPRLGRWDSEGCIRIPTRFNSFLDRTGLIDAKEREAARDDRRFAALLPKGTTPSLLAGQTVVVVDTSEPGALPSDPVKANMIAHPPTPGPEHDDAS